MLAIFNKELRSYFFSATAYIFMGIFLFISGIFFASFNALQKSPLYNNVLSGWMIFFFLILTPVLTMKTLAEESKTRTDQLLYTSPQNISSIVIAKYLAAIALFGITLLITLLFPIMLSLFGKLAVAEIFSSYLGFFLMGACFIAVGVFISSLTDNQVVAAIGTLGALLALYIIDVIQNVLPNSLASGVVFAAILIILITLIVYSSTRNITASAGTFLVSAMVVAALYIKNKVLFEGFIGKFFNWLSIMKRYDTFNTGIINVSSIIYYISFSFVFVFLTIRMIDKRRWS